MENNFPRRYYAYDGSKNVYTSKPLEGLKESMTKQVTIFDTDRQRDREYTVTIKLAAEIDLSVLHEKILREESLENNRMKVAVQCLEIIFKGNSARVNWIQSGRGFFNPAKEIPIGKGKQIRTGFTHSVILGSKPFLNLDMLYKIFPKSGDVLNDILEEVCGNPPPRGPPGRGPPGRGPPQRGYDRQQQSIDLRRPLNDDQKADLEEFIKGLKVEVDIPGRPESEKRKYRVNGLEKCPSQNRFDKDGRMMTVQQYFLEEKGYQIRYPELPCLWVGGKDKKICFPIEVCKIVPNQAKRFRNTDSDTREIGRVATCDTNRRSGNIMDNAKRMGLNQSAYLKDFGVGVASEFKQVDSRILIHPRLGYRTSEVEVRKGEWKPDVFKISKPLTKWCILVLDNRTNKDDVFRFKKILLENGRRLGMTIADIPESQIFFENSRMRENELANFFKGLKKKYDVQIVFVVIPDFKEIYSKVKKAGEIGSSVLTSCIKGKNLQRANDSILKNILIKVNTKLNNLNHILLPVPQLKAQDQWCIEKRTMILGADVTHPAPQDKKIIPSVAAVVASHDREGSLYNMEWNFQNPSVKDHEIIQDLNEMVAKQLKFYIEKTGGKPERLLFFRDGVSDGQIDEVRYREIRAIKEACKKVLGNYIPLTFVIVQKRHRTRFFPDPQDKREDNLIYDRNYNVPAGTVIDKEIVRQDMFEFYLVSHASILGTARPTKYKTILDESNITADELEHLTYYLCHMYNRCSRTVSYPTPTYYAHLACFRIRNYLLTERINMDRLRDEKKRLQGEASFYLNNPLYFI